MTIAPHPSPSADRTSPKASADTLTVLSRRTLTSDIVELTLGRPEGGRLPDWTPGSHIDLILPSGSVRQYSLCGDRMDPLSYRIAVLRTPDGRGGSAEAHTLTPGTAVRFGGPRNNFRLGPASSYRFIAGGIGITPLLPMIRQAAELEADWRLLYLGRRSSALAYLPELAPHGDRVQVHCSHDAGRQDIAAWLGEMPDDCLVYACGPNPLLDDAEALRDRFSGPRIRTERFTGRAQSQSIDSSPYDITLAQSGRVIRAEADQTIGEALRAGGTEVVMSCGQGVCGTCELSVLRGEPDHRDSILDEQERDEGACVYPCVSRSLSKTLVLDL